MEPFETMPHIALVRRGQSFPRGGDKEEAPDLSVRGLNFVHHDKS